MENKLGIRHVLDAHGFNLSSNFKLVRHAPTEPRYDRRELFNGPWFPLYQAVQTSPVYQNCDFIVVFTADGGTRAKFFAIYRVLKVRTLRPHDIPEECPHKSEWRTYDYFYELQQEPQYVDLEGRVVIDWGKALQSWVQSSYNENDKPVVEILPSSKESRLIKPFTDYLDFTLSYAELTEMIENAGEYIDWQKSLSAVAGVYLILAETTGLLYVGAAYGEHGIWGRWTDHAANGHGGAALLRDLTQSKPEYPESFRYSVLQVLPKSATENEVRRWEKLYKKKLGTLEKGLNLN